GVAGVAAQAHRTAIERDAALAEARRSDSIVQTMTLMLGQSGSGGDLTLKQTLDASAARLLLTLDGSARSGRLIGALSDLYVNVQDGKGSYDLLKAALVRGIGRDDPATTAKLKATLADGAMAIGAPDDAVALLDQAERVLARDPERNAIELQQIIGSRAGIARRKHDYDRAIGLLLTNLPGAERAFVGDASAMLTRYNNLLIYLTEANRLREVGPILARAQRIMELPGERDSIQALGLTVIGGAWQLRGGDPAGAERTFAAAAERWRTLYGDTAGLANSLSWRGRAQLAQGKFAAARDSLAEAKPLAVRYLGPRALPTLTIEMASAQTQAEMGDVAGARTTIADVHAAATALPQPNVIVPQAALVDAVIALKAGQPAAAAAAAARARAEFTAMGPAGAWGLTQLSAVERRIGTR
ncbi:hypothetical protein, partial [Sphingomonas bacterium]|uniref:hypothetical protein n=1 Tax=Sphingomonas bacterium TaxID=1895847 RepID=UPI001C2D0F47